MNRKPSLNERIANMMDSVAEEYKDTLSVHDYNQLKSRARELKSQEFVDQVKKNKLSEAFKQAFPEFSPTLITWFRKNKDLL